MADKVVSNISVENARIIFRNFSGKPGKYNAEGKRSFCLIIDNDVAESLKADGWNIKYLSPRDPDEVPQAYLQVAVSFGSYPPNIWLIAGNKKTKMNEDTVSALDYAEIENVDLIVRPYNWSVNGNSGVRAYLKNMYVTIVQNEFEKKYRDLEDDENDLPF